jgi:hypothetical protein
LFQEFVETLLIAFFVINLRRGRDRCRLSLAQKMPGSARRSYNPSLPTPVTKLFACVCGKRFGCIIRILPAPPIGRTKCEWWPESIFPECFESMLTGADREQTIDILKSLIECGDEREMARDRIELPTRGFSVL